MELHDVVMKLVGPVEAIGDSHFDAERLANLKALTGLVEKLLLEIHAAARSANNHQDSMRAIGRYAMEFLTETCK
jgi:hypothetical protein